MLRLLALAAVLVLAACETPPEDPDTFSADEAPYVADSLLGVVQRPGFLAQLSGGADDAALGAYTLPMSGGASFDWNADAQGDATLRLEFEPTDGGRPMRVTWRVPVPDSAQAFTERPGNDMSSPFPDNVLVPDRAYTTAGPGGGASPIQDGIVVDAYVEHEEQGYIQADAGQVTFEAIEPTVLRGTFLFEFTDVEDEEGVTEPRVLAGAFHAERGEL